MKSCAGLPSSISSTQQAPDTSDDEYEEELSFPCEPSTVIYGHAASRGLDVKRYSMGLDTGCLYGQRLTALVVSRGSGSHSYDEEDEEEDDDDDDDDGDDEDDEESSSRRRLGRRQHGGKRKGNRRGGKVKFGDAGAGLDARLVQVKCTLPPESDSHDH